MSSTKVKANQLWGKPREELLKQLADLRQELVQLRTHKVSPSGVVKYMKIHDIRKGIARILTVINITQRDQLRAQYKTKKYLPLDLREKKTRAIRRRLSPKDAARVTERTRKRTIHFPQRIYAVKASV